MRYVPSRRSPKLNQQRTQIVKTKDRQVNQIARLLLRETRIEEVLVTRMLSSATI
jgi:hypothetical protein